MDPCAALRNSDIWHLILSLVDRKTRSALVQTCRSLNHEAAPYLLGHVVLQELGSEKLSSFVRFIAPRDDDEESAYRLRSLRGLSLEIDHTPLSLDALLALFIRLQQHATNLTRLQVTVLHAATQLSGVDSAARLGSGIGSLRYLTDLELNFHQALPYREAIQTMHSRLMTLRLGDFEVAESVLPTPGGPKRLMTSPWPLPRTKSSELLELGRPLNVLHLD